MIDIALEILKNGDILKAFKNMYKKYTSTEKNKDYEYIEFNIQI